MAGNRPGSNRTDVRRQGSGDYDSEWSGCPEVGIQYLYHKNSQQQINPQNLDEYVEMFKLYKMKVADAKAEGIDTLSSFIKETEQYRHDLAAPYLQIPFTSTNLSTRLSSVRRRKWRPAISCCSRVGTFRKIPQSVSG